MSDKTTKLDYPDEAVILVDRLLPFYPDFDEIHCAAINYFDESYWSEEDKTALEQNAGRIEKLLLKFGYAEVDEVRGHFQLTDKGREAKKEGGHFAYLKQLSDKAAIEKERQMLSDEKLKLEIQNSRRIFKTYWWTFAFALVSFLYVLLQLALKVFSK